MQSFNSYLTEQFLIESQYEDMFKDIGFNPAQFEKIVKADIAWAKKVLKKQDRITWYLKVMRAWNSDSELVDAKYPKLKDWHDKVRNEMSYIYKYERGGYISAEASIKGALEHFFSLNLHEIESIVFKDQLPRALLEELGAAEDEWKESLEGLIPEEEVYDQDKPIVKVDSNWDWWLLPRNYCTQEGQAMGHCGNQGSRDEDGRVISLRERVKKGGKIFYRPALTFILGSDKLFGEMKGRGNDKPAEKYFPAIMKLFKTKGIAKGIKGGGYLPSHNFQWSDFSDSQKREVLQANPDFIGNIYELTDEQAEKHSDLFKEMMEELYSSVSFMDRDHHKINREWYYLGKYDDALEFLKAVSTKNNDHVLNSEPYEDIFDRVDVQRYQMREFFNDLPADIQNKIEQKYGIEEIDGSEIEDSHPELFQMASDAILRGYEAGTYEIWQKLVMGALDDALEPHNALLVEPGKFEKIKYIQKDEKVHLIIRIKDLLNYARQFFGDSDSFDSDFFGDFGSLSHEYEYDEKAAHQAFKEEL